MEIRVSPDPVSYGRLSTDDLRRAFLIESLFSPDRIGLVYTDADRAIAGSAVPASRPLDLAVQSELRAAFFCERRELGILNIGGAGTVEVDGAVHALGPLDGLYVGRGSRAVRFASAGAEPAAFYLLSYPAHAAHPTARIGRDEAAAVELGSAAEANRRTIRKYIHPGGVRSCQLVMGWTQLHEGSVWNTMPPHTHTRRSEVYLYFGMSPGARVMHFMGLPAETRHLVAASRQAVISPSWSIHCGCGTGPYSFCWGMGGENQEFGDMDGVGVEDLK